jgi:hypothetical protein
MRRASIGVLCVIGAAFIAVAWLTGAALRSGNVAIALILIAAVFLGRDATDTTSSR